ncbi:MAG: hypothetical protein Q7O66_18805, partial [Dehalococcoidia bacterium]|nr:hypothetical protein [Dehalococcoidia bacterium]
MSKKKSGCVDVSSIAHDLWRPIELPIAGLQLQGQEMKLGHVAFTSMDQQELDEWYKGKATGESFSQTCCRLYGAPPFAKAIITSPGDNQEAAEFAIAATSEALDTIRAFCAPL